MRTMNQFIAENNLKMEIERTLSNPLMDDSRDKMSHWTCTI